MFENIITKEYINENVRPFSGNDSLYNSCVREVILFDISILPDDLKADLQNDLAEASDDRKAEVLKLLDDDLRLSIAYFAYSRAIRTGESTITKYGYTAKSSDNSLPTSQDKIVSDSTYFKNLAEKLFELFISKHRDLFNNKSNKPIKDSYLKCKIIGE